MIGACTRQDRQSQALETYLSETHGLNINDSMIYCFFPANQCRNCFLYQSDYLIPEINEHTIIITGFDSSNFKGFKHVLHDRSNHMLELEALGYGNRIITFQKGNISRNIVVEDLYAQLGNVWLNLDDNP